MNQTHITQCPKCDTTFRVSPNQLKAANGAVRCGACLHVFRAAKHFQTSKPASTSTQDDTRTGDLFKAQTTQAKHSNNAGAQTPLKEKPPIKSQPLIDDGDDFLIDDGDDFLIDDDNGLIDDENGIDDGDLIDDNYLNKTPIISDIDEDFLSLNTQDHADPFATESDKLTDEVESTDKSRDEEWAESLLDDSDDADVLEQQSQQKAPPKTPKSDAKSVTPIKPTTTKPAFSYVESDPLDLSLPNQPKRTAFWLITCACLILIVSLVVQMAYFNFDQWSRHQQYRPYYAMACEHLKCQLPSHYDVSQIRTTASPQVTSHPKFKDALSVDVLFMNHATYEQAFPKLQLTFTDQNNTVVAQRVFSPREYLAGEASGLSMMPTQTPIHIALEIKDPGSKANNYQVRFLAP